MPAKAASDAPSVSLSFANNFWGKDDAGVGPLLERMHNAKVTSDELKAFYTARAQIEEEYAKKLLALARKPLGSAEGGTLRMSLDVVRGEVESMGKAHQLIAGQMKSELEEPLAAFTGGIKERRKIVQNGVEKLLKLKNQQTLSVNKTRDRFEQDCLKIKGYLAQGHMVMGQEERKNKAKLEKTQIQMSSNSGEYEGAVKILEETTGRWNREWKAACDKFQDLEEERLDFFKSSLWSFANIASTVCVSDDQACEKMRLSLEDCEVEKDITTFIKEYGTGQEIPDPPKYINFCRGDYDDASSTHESDDGNYSVAQFQRTINPTFRTSSPQPSTFESHNDPDTSLREEMGIPKSRTSMQGDDAFNVLARSSHGSAAPPPALNTSQNSAPPTHPYGDNSMNPQQTFATDSTASFPRMAPPSERSSIPSPTRPDSRDSHRHSDYSAPTSFEDLARDNASPTKHFNASDLSGVSSGYNDSAISGMSGGTEDKNEQKKKSGFFQSHSPFRRRSTKEKAQPPLQQMQPPQQQHRPQPISQPSSNNTPTSRNTWTPATVRRPESAGAPSSKPFTRPNPWNKQPSVEPEPVDPRAEYQLGIGNNVFDVASPDARKKPVAPKAGDDQLDPIAQALAELKGVAKQASVRQSADRHYGMSTPVPGTPARSEASLPAGSVPTPFANMGIRGTPPPAYDTTAQPVSRLGAPQPAHTAREMRKATEQYTAQKRDMFNNNSVPVRPKSSMGRPPSTQQQQDPPRSASPAPPRAASPRPFVPADPRQQLPSQQQQQQQPTYRSASPNPYGGTPGTARPRAQSSSPIKPQQPPYANPNNGYASRGNSPSYQPAPRAASPNPAYAAPPTSNSRPPSSRGSDYAGGGGGGMALQLAPAPGPAQDMYGGGGAQRTGRPQSQYYPGGGAGDGQQVGPPRARSQSVAGQRQVTKSGQAILHYARAMYMYQAAIPEELSFAKGDVLAVTRHQDDGWWEAEVMGKNGGCGLVPSNYLKHC